MNPPRRRRKGYRRKRNPNGVVGKLKGLFRIDTWVDAGQGLAGLSAGLVLPGMIARAIRMDWLDQGIVGVLFTGATTIGASMLANSVSPRLGRNVAVGGGIAAALRLIGYLAPGIAAKLLGATPISVALPRATPKTGSTGFGDVMTADDLVRDEGRSLRGTNGISDWLELKGLSGGSEARLPYESVRGIGMDQEPEAALNDWIETMGVPAEAGVFVPGAEGF